MAELKDSGSRREFDSGAVRDVQEGKGRCDLLPLDVVSSLMGMYLSRGPVYFQNDEVIEFINQYVVNGDVENLYTAIRKFIDREDRHICTAILEVAKHYEQGARKYTERNWEKGIPLHCYIDSGVRHYLKHMRGDSDEPHDRAFIWNMLGAIWTHIHKPELIDLPFNKDLNTTPTPTPSIPVSSPENEDIQSRAERIAERLIHCRETSFA